MDGVPMTAPICIAIVGDLHGYAREMLELVADATEEGDDPFDAILCVGDVGVIEHEDKIDRATRKWAFAGKPELGIAPDPRLISWPADFIREEVPLDDLYKRLDCGGRQMVPIFAVCGNHDDYDYLVRLSAGNHGATYPVDPRGRWHFFRRGAAVEINGVRIVGCGGIRPPEKKKPVGRHLLPEDYMRLAGAGRCDILLTHDAPSGIEGIPGDADLREAGLKTRPKWWFFGHFHQQVGPVELVQGCKCVGMGICTREEHRMKGVLGILTLDGNDAVWRWVV